MASAKHFTSTKIELPKETSPPQEVVLNIPLSDLRPFPNHPFGIRDDDSMKETIDSIKEYGVLVPAIVRASPEGGYEIISGHRRKHASELAGRETMPCIVRDLDDDSATIIMVDSNLQRESILPSERAMAYKMKLEAIKRKAGRRTKDNCAQVGHNSESKRSIEIIAQDAGESRSQVQRYIRLTELSPPLQTMVDGGRIALTPAVELSYLKPEEQSLLVETIESEQNTPSLSQAQRMRKLSQIGKLNDDTMLSILQEQKKPIQSSITIPGEKLRKYFPKSYTPRQIEDTIFKLLDAWHRRREQTR